MVRFKKSVAFVLLITLFQTMVLNLALLNPINVMAAGTVVRYESSEAVTNGLSYGSSTASEGEKIGNLGDEGASVCYSVYAPQTGAYNMYIGYGSGDSGTIKKGIYVNDVRQTQVNLAPTGSGDVYTESDAVVVNLTQGMNTVAIKQVSSEGDEKWYDLDYVEFEGVTPPPEKPNLVLKKLEWSPKNPKAGEAVTFRAVLENIGRVPTSNGAEIKIGYYVNDNLTAWSTYNSAVTKGGEITLLASGGPGDIKKWTAALGDFQIKAVVDVDNTVDEIFEADNEYVKGLNVSETLVPGNVTFVDDMDADVHFSGEWTNQYWDFCNEGTIHETDKSAAEVSYTFTGAKAIQVIGQKPDWGGSAQVIIDNGTPVSVSYKSSFNEGKAIIFCANNLDVNATHTIRVVSNGGGFVYIDGFYLSKENFEIVSSANLKGIYVGGAAISGFDKDKLSYNVLLPYGTTNVPEIKGVSEYYGQTVTVLPPSDLPGTATVVVESQDETQTKTYTLSLSVNDSLRQVEDSDGWFHTDVGTTADGSNAVYQNGAFTINCAAVDMWNQNDGFHFVFKQHTGNIDIKARVARLDKVQDWTKAAIMIRESLDGGSKYYGVVRAKNNIIQSQWRNTQGGNSDCFQADAGDAQWIRLVRKANKFETYWSTNGTDWTKINTRIADLPDQCYLGFAVTSNDIDRSTTAVFDNIEISIPESDPLSKDASIKDLRVNGIKVPGFKPEQLEYTFTLSSRHRTRSVPVITATVNNEFAKCEALNPLSIPGTVELKVTSEDGSVTNTYKINLVKSAEPEKISRTTSWVGNTFGGVGEILKGGWVQNFINDMYVAPDGTCYTASGWDEAGRTHGVYKDGKAIGNNNMNIDSKRATDQTGTVWEIPVKELVRNPQGDVINRVYENYVQKAGTSIRITGPDAPQKPTALAIANDGRLMVADDKRSQILFYDISGETPVFDHSFGEAGGISAGEPGVITPAKFWAMTGIGMDAEGNIYVAMSHGGSFIRKLTPQGELVWEVNSTAFLDCFDFDPTTDGRDIYGLEEHYVMDYSKGPGEEAALVARTLDMNKYPNDPRNFFKGVYMASVDIRYINGKKFMFSTGQFPGIMAVYRFEGEMAVPSTIYSREHVRQTTDGITHEIPNQPETGGWIWRDLNGDGDFQANEFVPTGLNDPGAWAWWVDEDGNMWRQIADGKLATICVSGLDEHGNPIYNLEDIKIGDIPSEFQDVRRIQYIKSTDTMYITGYDHEDPYEGDLWGCMGRVIYRYDNWSKETRTLHPNYPVKIPYYALKSDSFGDQAFDIAPQALHVVDDKIFMTYGARGPLGFKTGEMHVLDADTGEDLGAVTPGPEVGGYANVGWVDIPQAVRGIKLSDGNYKVIVEEDYKAKQLLYTVTPYNGVPEMDGEQEVSNVPTVKAQKIPTPANIDGKLDERFWELSAKAQKQTGGTESSNEVAFGTAWDDQYLYVGVKVKDSALYGESPDYPWEDDAIEVFVDGNNDKGGAYDSHDVQYIKSWNNTGLFANNSNTKNVKHAIAKSADGYIVEMAIPWADLKVSPEKGAKIGFDIANDDDLNGDTRDACLVWAGDGGNFQSTSNFGNVLLADDTYLTPKAAGTITVDGVFDEEGWDVSRKLEKQIGGAINDNTVRFGTMWDNQNLYIGVEVKDNELNGETPDTPWEDDAIELFIDANNDKGGAYDSHDAQLIKSWNNTGIFSNNGNLKNIKHTIKGIDGGYTVEMSIPWADLRVSPNAGDFIGFDIANDEDIGGGGRHSVLGWAGDGGNFQSTEKFGNLKLMGEGDVTAPATPTPMPTPTPTETPTPTPTPTPIPSSSVVVKLPEVKEAGTAVAVVNSQEVQNAFKYATEAKNGEKQVTVELKPVEGAKEYSLKMPADVFNSEAKKDNIEINTPAGSVTVPLDMFKDKDIKGASEIGISISDADVSGLDSKTRAKIGNRPVVDLNVTVDGQTIAWKNSNAPVVVSIKYTPTEEELKNPNKIVVWYIDAKGKATPVANAKYNPETGMVTFKTTHFSIYAVTHVNVEFTDMEQFAWAKDQAETLAAKGIMPGTSEKKFSPAEAITRAEFIDALVKAMDLNAEFDTNFKDVNKYSKYYQSIGVAKKLGLVEGVGGSRFNPDKQISRQDMAVIIEKVLRKYNKITATGSGADIAKFADAAKVSKYAVNAVAALVNEGVLSCTGENLNPLVNATRVETAMLIFKVYEESTK